jgi:hypothetical protein
MNIVEKAFSELYPDREFNYVPKIKYSRRFNAYNANVRMHSVSREIVFSLSRNWKSVSEDIKIGLLQELMIKLFREKERPAKRTMNIDLYNAFIKNVHIAAPKIESEPQLVESFNRVNDAYFHGLIDMPNLVFGQNSRRKLGCYEYGSDTITISRILENAPLNLMDYVMYHEVLHKKHKFSNRNGKNFHHTSEFKYQESLFSNQKEVEKGLTEFLRGQRRLQPERKRRGFFGFNFFD